MIFVSLKSLISYLFDIIIIYIFKKDKIRQFVIFKGLVVVSAYKYMVYVQILQEKLVY